MAVVPGAGFLVFPGLIKKSRTEDFPTTQGGTQTNTAVTKQSCAKAKARHAWRDKPLLDGCDILEVEWEGGDVSLTGSECGVKVRSSVDALEDTPVPKARKVAPDSCPQP